MLITDINSNNLNARILKRILIKELGYESIKDFQKKNNLTDDGLFGMRSYTTLYSLYLKVREVNFNGHYFRDMANKKQIVLHHSASADSADNMFNWWRVDGVRHVATSIGITDSGDIVRGYDEAYWAHHIGMRNQHNHLRNLESVGVEICNWGYLTKVNGKYFNYVNEQVPEHKVIELNFRGQKYYEIYTDLEIEALRKWILMVALRFNIPLTYKAKDLWEVSQDAITGVPGIYTHCSYISSKSDVSPQPKLIKMLEDLNPSVL